MHLWLHREDFGLLSCHVSQTAHGVAADIERRATSEFVAQAEVTLAEPDVGRPEAGFQVNQSAELSASYELSLATQPLEVANVHGFNENEAALPSQLEQALRLVRILRQRLLAEHMFARFERPTPPFVMEGGREARYTRHLCLWTPTAPRRSRSGAEFRGV